MSEVVVRDVLYPPEEVAARREPLPARFGALSPLGRQVSRIPRPRAELLEGLREQELRLRVGGKTVVFRQDAENGPFPFERPVVLVSVDVHEYHRVADSQLVAVAVARDRQWLDQMLVRPDDRSALALAAELGSRFVLRWSDEGMSVVDVRTAEVAERFCVQGKEVVYRTCPVLCDAARGDLCKKHGGPWVSASMIAAVNWTSRRSLFLQYLGCDVCGAQSTVSDGVVPTRYDDWVAQAMGCDTEAKAPNPAEGLTAISTPTGLVIADAQSPVVLAKGRIVEVGLPEASVWQELDRIVIDPAGGSEDPLDWPEPAPYWMASQADLERRVRGLEFVHRWAVVGPLRVTGVRLGDDVRPLAFDLRVPRPVVQSELMHLSRWEFSTAGAWRLGLTHGLHECEAFAVRANEDLLDVGQWLAERHLLTLAALALEPFDVDDELEGFTRSRMLSDRRAILGPDHTVGVDPVMLRESLLDTAEYRRARRAMRWPSADRAFWDRLREAAKTPRITLPFRC